MFTINNFGVLIFKNAKTARDRNTELMQEKTKGLRDHIRRIVAAHDIWERRYI